MRLKSPILEINADLKAKCKKRSNFKISCDKADLVKVVLLDISANCFKDLFIYSSETLETPEPTPSTHYVRPLSNTQGIK